MKITYIVALIIIFSVIFLPAVLLFGIKEFSYNPQPSLDATQRIFGDVLVSQTFISRDNNLSDIGMSIKNPNLRNKENIMLALYENGLEKRRVVVNGRNIGDGDFVKFKFTPLGGSKDKEYVYTLSAPGVFESESLEVFHTGKSSPGFNMTVDNKTIEGSISSVSFYQPENIFSLIGKVYLEWINKLAADGLFFGFYTVMILVLSGYLIGFRIPKFWRG